MSPNKNLVTRALGVDLDMLLELNEHNVEVGDLYLVCSDGLSDMMDDSEIANILESGASLDQMAAALIRRANDNGGRDNITVLMTQAADAPEKRGLISRLLGK